MVLVTIPYWYDDECRVYRYYRFGNTGKWDSDAYICMRYLIMYIPIVRPMSMSLVPVPVVVEILYISEKGCSKEILTLELELYRCWYGTETTLCL